MGREDVVSNEYLGSPERVADLLNGYVYHGEGRISAGEVKELRNVFNRVRCDAEDGAESHGAEHGAKQRVRRGGASSGVQTITADIVREIGEGVKAMIVAIEDQTAIHYAMPIRMMNLEAAGYHTQWRQTAGAHKARKDLAGAEYLSGFAKGERLKPFLPIVLYFGKEPWDGPKCLKDMIDLGAYSEEIKALITDYPLHLIEVRRYEGYEKFRTDLRYVFGFLRNAENKENLKRYLRENEAALMDLNEDAYDVISTMGHSEELQMVKDKCEKEEGRKNDMCQGIIELIEEGRQEGVEQGRREGVQMGIQENLVQNVNNLMKNLGLALGEACKALGTTEDAYMLARKNVG